MFSSYVSTAVRALTKHRMHLVLNVLGLAVGLGATLLVALYTLNETSYDAFQPEVDSTYRVVQRHIEANVHHPLISPALHDDIQSVDGVSDVMDLVTADSKINQAVRVGGETLKLSGVMAATQNVRSFIALQILHGDLAEALSKPNEIALSESEARRLFGQSNAVGDVVNTGDKAWKVAAVFADLPENTHFGFKALISVEQFTPSVQRFDSYSYVKLREGVDLNKVSREIERILNAKVHQDRKIVEIYLQPLREIHLSDLYEFRMTPAGSKRTVSIAIALSAFLLLIASFNFINLSTAQAGLRATEVGIRKTLGASRGQLVFQFLSESTLVAVISAIIGCAMAELALPLFNEIVGRRLSIDYLSEFGLVVVGATLFVGLFAGLYPAMFLSSFSAKRTLSGDLQRGLTAVWVRKALLATQAALSISLIVGAATLWLQLKHLNSVPLGYEKENRIIASTVEQQDFPHLLRDDGLYAALRNIDDVVAVTISDLDPTTAANASIKLRGAGSEGAISNIGYSGVGFDAVETLGLTLVAGRDFSTEHQADWFRQEGDSSELGIIITESLLDVAGFETAEAAINRSLIIDGGPLTGVAARIVGVVKDVRLGSLRDLVVPTIFGCGLSWTGTSSIYLELAGADRSRVADSVRDMLRERLHMPLIEVDSLEQRYSALYRGERQQAQVVAIFSGLAVFLTCVGLFGMASFSAHRRSREVAIRRVMGASRIGLVNLLAKEYLVLTGASALIALPVTYWMLSDWLSNFNDRIEQSAGIYVAAAVLVMLITWATVSLVAFRVASAKPAAMLKSD